MRESSLDAAAFGQLFEQYKPGFLAIARSYVRDGMVAEDIVVDAFIAFWEKRNKIQISQSIPSYILASVKNRCLNWLRNEKKRLEIQGNIHSVNLRIISQRIETLETNNPESLFVREISTIVEDKLQEMPARMRKTYMSSRIDGMTYKEIAEKNGYSINQVDFEIRKATKILMTALKDYIPVVSLLLLL